MAAKNKKKNELKNELEQKIQQQFSDYIAVEPNEQTQSIEYEQFVKENTPQIGNTYEQLCKTFGKLPSFDPPDQIKKQMQDAIETCHLSMSARDATAFAVYGSLLAALFLFTFTILITGDFIVSMLMLAIGLGIMYPALFYPKFLMDRWRMRAGNQMVLATFYIVTYMRHTSNLERAIQFASDHLGPPLSFDFRKVLWDVETEKYETITASLENYLQMWKGNNDHFIEAIQLIQSSLYEEQEKKRLAVLDKALDITLDQTYERMLHYAHNLQSPITTLHMLGVILPILGLVILPLMIAFMPEVRWYHVALIYNFIIPVSVYYIGMRVLEKRPSGYGSSTVDENNPELIRRQKEKSGFFGKLYTKAGLIATSIIILFVVIGFFPIWAYWIAPDFDIGFGEEVGDSSSCGYQFCLLGYHLDVSEASPTFGQMIGPYGLGASLMSLFIPLGLGLGLAIFFTLKSQNAIEIRRETESLEAEFGSSLFQLSNRLDDGMPPEAAVSAVAENMADTASGSFFRYVANNIQKLGMSLHEAIFNIQVGALMRYPSNLIESSMKVLVESAKKGPKISAQALGNIARYLKEMHRVDERLKDLMAEVLSSMKSQINFLTPIIAGIVIGITSMITNILSTLTRRLGDIGEAAAGDVGGMGGAAGLADLFHEGLPTFYFQVIVGLYVVQIVYVLSILINGINNGVDPLEEKSLLGSNLLKSVGLYILIAGIVMVVFNIIAASIIGRTL